jgi:transcriptional regulator of heat shock response
VLLPICNSAPEETALNNKAAFNRAFDSGLLFQEFSNEISSATRVYSCVLYQVRQDFTGSNRLLLALNQNYVYLIVVQSEYGRVYRSVLAV